MSDPAKIGESIRAYRNLNGLSLEDLADRLAEDGCERPSIAKLSRIETGVQPVSDDILPTISKLTGIPVLELRPDIARLLGMSV